MPGLTLLNIDRETTSTGNPLLEIREIIDEIEGFISNLSQDVHPARMMPLKMKLRRLQDTVSQFGADGSIPVQEKQEYIMELHPDLQMLSNRLQRFGSEHAVQVEICMNFLLNHLCSTAASDPKSTVIGVSNVMAQVLSNDINIVEVPELNSKRGEPKFFEEFSREFNSMLTVAGLFAAPVLGLPDIPISALGGWADQALMQFSNINEFVRENYDPHEFYNIDKQENAVPFDTTTDILSFYVFENEFLAALITRADILSGLEFPGGFSDDGDPVTLQSTDDITRLLAHSISRNCNEILKHMDEIDKMFTEGLIDRNEKPEDHPDLMQYRTEAEYWLKISEYATLMVEIFEGRGELSSSGNISDFITRKDELPPINTSNFTVTHERLLRLLDEMLELLRKMFPKAEENTALFIKSSDFTRFRDYFQYIIHIVGTHDILLKGNSLWAPWLLDNFKSLLIGEAGQFNPINAVEIGMITLISGINLDLPAFIEQGTLILDNVKTYLEFQSHHLLAIEIILKLTKIYKSSPDVVAGQMQNIIQQFLDQQQVNPNSMLFQRANLYLAMLGMFEENGVYLRKSNERYVAFDPFSWIQTEDDLEIEFPYMPLNTSLDNLASN